MTSLCNLYQRIFYCSYDWIFILSNASNIVIRMFTLRCVCQSKMRNEPHKSHSVAFDMQVVWNSLTCDRDCLTGLEIDDNTTVV